MTFLKIVSRLTDLVYSHLVSKERYAAKKGVRVGQGCRIYTKSFGSEPFLIEIGENSIIGTGVKFVTHDGTAGLFSDEKGRRYYYSPISVGKNVFVGINSIILPGVKIEDNVVVAAGSLLNKSVPSNSIVAGIPAKIVGSYSDLQAKALKTWPSKKEMGAKEAFQERVMKITDFSFKPFLSRGY